MPHRVLLMISSMRGGGSEQQTLLLLRHLDRSRFTPHLYLTEKTGELMSRIPDDVIIHSFDDVEPTGGIYFPGRVLRRQVRHLQDLIARNSIDVIYDRTFLMTMIAGPASRRAGVPRVSTIVSPPERALPRVESRFVGLKRRRLAKAYRQASSVVAVSQQAAQSAERYYWLPSGAVRVVHNPVDAESIRKSVGAVKPGRDERLTLVCVGRMTEEKGHRDLVSAVIRTQSHWPEDSSPLRLWMVGDGPLRGELESQWNHGKGQHTIEFLGTQTNPTTFMAVADALVLPSHFEGMPNAVLESMAVGTPVIATRAGGTVELERDEPTILWAEPNDAKSLASAIVQFARDRDSACARADAATALIQSHHDVHAVTREIEDIMTAAL